MSARDQPPARKAVAPAAPSKEEYDRHVIDHAVYRPWCRHCVAGAGRRSKHVRVAGQTHDIPVVSIDYGFLPKGGTDSAEVNPQLEPSEASHSAPFLVCAESVRHTLLAEFVPAKGDDAYAVKRLTQHLLWVGHPEFRFQADGEPAIQSLRLAVTARLQEAKVRVTPDTAPKGDSNSNPWAESAVERVKVRARILWHWATETHGVKPATSSDLIPWCVKYSAQLIQLTHVGSDGMTAYRRVTGRREFVRPLVPWGCKVMYIPGGAKSKANLEKWLEGVFRGLY